MHNPTTYLKMRVLGAIDMAEGNSIVVRIRAVSQTTFTDEDGHARQFTWRTIQTWYSRYKKHGLTALEIIPRSDQGKTRKVSAESLLEAIEKVRPKLHGKTPKRATLYRLCIEQGLLTRSQVAPNTFSRLVKDLELLKPDRDCENKHRLAFAKAHANDEARQRADGHAAGVAPKQSAGVSGAGALRAARRTHVAGRHALRPPRQHRRLAGADPTDRVFGRRFASLLPRPVLCCGKRRHADRGDPRSLL